MTKPSLIGSQPMIEVNLGSETDIALWTRLHIAVASLGGSITESSWGLGGSQELTTCEISLPSGTLEVISETYIGVSLRGSSVLVKAVEDALRSV